VYVITAGKVKTHAPEEHSVMKEWSKHGNLEVHYAEHEPEYSWTPKKGPVLIAGGMKASPGDYFSVRDDGNMTTQYGRHSSTRYKVTGIAKDIEGVKKFPKGKYSLYSIK
jgi:hypothetical protein